MSTRKLDEALDRLLADDRGGELGALYRRLPRAEPPRRLDRNVLNEAARAVHGRRPRRQRWLVGFGSAAGLVLAAGVAWHVGHEALHQQEHEAVRGAPTYVPVQPIEAPARNRRESAPATDTAASAAPAAPPLGAAEQGKARAAKPVAEKAAPPRVTTPAPAPPPPPPPAAAEPQPMLQSAPAPAATKAERRAEPTPVDSAAASADSAQEREIESKQAADVAAPAARAHTGMPAPSSSVELRRDTQLAPEAWLARIEQLLRQGRRQQAIESLQLFRRMHPDWQLSEELRALDD